MTNPVARPPISGPRLTSALARILWGGLALALSAGCAANSTQPHPDQGALAYSHPDYDRAIQVRYLGVAGYQFRRGDYAVMTAPLYTNPHFVRVGLWFIRPDTALIDWVHPHPPELQVPAILVGHAHYDHLLDVPYIARKYHPEARIYGSPSVASLALAAEPSLALGPGRSGLRRSHSESHGEAGPSLGGATASPGSPGRVIALDDQVARNRRPGTWFYAADSTIRFMAIASGHGPHALGVHLMRGSVKPGLRRVPLSAWRWREGETLAYLIDFLGPDRSVDFRIYYQDATSPDSTGFPPLFPPQDRHPIDLAVLCVGSAQQLREYPTNICTELQPRNIMLGHWENFFRSPVRPAKRLRFIHINRFITEVEAASPDSRWVLPKPGAVYHYFLHSR